MTKVDEALAQMETMLENKSAKAIAADLVSEACVVAFNQLRIMGAGDPDTLRASIAAAILAEREACAKIADDMKRRWVKRASGLVSDVSADVADQVAAAIRARGKE